ncbi:hypothetical protein [Bacillus dakarensis]|uniref:hypothetical protein n=1 Tax=Robertmurraya dakarensis TaxID=1926278 RepID=UPI0009811960|nr:hypothetical protein [Bacillus dakarensis]
MKKMLTILLATSIPFGWTIYIAYKQLALGVIAGLLFGACIAIGLVTINYLFTKSAGEGLDSSVNREKEIEVHLNYNHAFEVCKSSISALRNAKIMNIDYREGIIHVRTAANFRTLGEQIILSVQEISDEVCKIHLQSKPAYPTTVVDYGKNIENIKLLTSYFEQQA